MSTPPAPAPEPPPEPTPAPTDAPRQPTSVVGYAEPGGYSGLPVTTTDRPHFPRTIEDDPGPAVCGQCGMTWPCSSNRAGAPDVPDGSAGRVYSGGVMPVELAAEAAGIPADELQRRAAGLLAERLP